MSNTAAICDSFRKELLNGSHAFGTQAANGTRTITTKDTFKIALYLASATYDRTTTAYSATGEVGNSGSYVAGGLAITNATAPANTGGTGIISFWTPSAAWTTGSGFTSSGAHDACLLYNTASTGNLAVMVLTYGSTTVTSGTFTINMPTNDLTTGLLRVS